MRISEQLSRTMKREWNAAVRAMGHSTLALREGPMPATCEMPDRGALLVAFRLPDDWMKGCTVSAPAERTGEPGHYRAYGQDGTCYCQFDYVQGSLTGQLGTDMVHEAGMIVTLELGLDLPW